MSLNKKRKKDLRFVILMSILAFGFAIVINHFDTDEYIVSWLFAMSQALFVFAVFRFKTIKNLQRKSDVVKRVTIAILWFGAMVTLVGVLLSKYSPYKYSEEISHIGSFIAGLGINGLISYVSNHFDFSEEAEDKKHKKEKRKSYKKQTRK